LTPLENIMNVKRGIVLMCLLALCTLVRAQSSVDGTWAGEIPGGRGPQQVTLTLKADGGKVTGSLQGGRGGPINIEEGTISGANIKFKTTQQGRGGQVTFNWTGSLKGDEIAFTRMAEGGQEQKFTVKKQK
jgi:hypothetical protein